MEVEKRSDFYEGRNIKNEVFYKNDLRHGLFKHYYVNGQIKIEADYCEGQLSGKWLEYYENGEIQEIGFYKNGEYFPKDFWSKSGNQLMKDGTGIKIERFGSSGSDIYIHYIRDMKLISEVRIQESEIEVFEKMSLSDILLMKYFN